MPFFSAESAKHDTWVSGRPFCFVSRERSAGKVIEVDQPSTCLLFLCVRVCVCRARPCVIIPAGKEKATPYRAVESYSLGEVLLSGRNSERELIDMADSGFNSKSIGLKIQKKVLGKLSTKAMAKAFIDDNLGKLLDVLHSVLKAELGDSKKADKVIKNMIKVTVKIGLLYKNNQFNQDELALGAKFRTKLRHAALTVISFYEVDFTYDRAFLIKVVNECGDMLHRLVDRHLSEKSHQRINMVIEAFSNGTLLDKVFLSDGAYHHHLKTLAEGFDKVVDAEW